MFAHSLVLDNKGGGTAAVIEKKKKVFPDVCQVVRWLMGAVKIQQKKSWGAVGRGVLKVALIHRNISG